MSSRSRFRRRTGRCRCPAWRRADGGTTRVARPVFSCHWREEGLETDPQSCQSITVSSSPVFQCIKIYIIMYKVRFLVLVSRIWADRLSKGAINQGPDRSVLIKSASGPSLPEKSKRIKGVVRYNIQRLFSRPYFLTWADRLSKGAINQGPDRSVSIKSASGPSLLEKSKRIKGVVRYNYSSCFLVLIS